MGEKAMEELEAYCVVCTAYYSQGKLFFVEVVEEGLDFSTRINADIF
jgi:hypothetical protein